MTIDPRERLRQIDPAPPESEPPSGAIEAVAVIHEIERRMGMDTRDTTNDTDTPLEVTEQIEPGPSETTNDTLTKQAGKRRWSGALVGVAAFVVVVAVGAAVLLASWGSDDQAPTTQTPTTQATSDDPAVILAAYVEALNSGDVDAAMAFYADDAVVKDHPADLDDIATGVDEIRSLAETSPRAQGSGDGMEISGLDVSGSTVTFNHRFFWGADGDQSGGSAGCVFSINDKVTVVDGKITLYDWGIPSQTPCS